MCSHVWSLNYSSLRAGGGGGVQFSRRGAVSSHSLHSVFTINRHLWVTTMTLNIFYKATNSRWSQPCLCPRSTHPCEVYKLQSIDFLSEAEPTSASYVGFRAGLSVGHVFIWHQFGSSYRINYLGHDYYNFCRSLPQPDVARYTSNYRGLDEFEIAQGYK